ncbi:MAG TPA: hypothetical protein DCG54_07640 [Anaerolineae bacterium]|jgi:hypothetical protein|nr:hypothetical protein [Anaerolineae bacterium]
MLLGSAYGKVGLDTSGIKSGVSSAISALKNFKNTMQLAAGGVRTLENNLKTAKMAVASARAELERLKATKAAAPEIKAAADNLRKLEQEARNAAQAVKTAQAQLQGLAQIGLKVGAVMQNVGNMLTIGLTLPILALGGAALKTATDFEETKNKAVVVFEDMSDSVLENAEKADTALGLSAEKYLDYSSSIAAALKAGGMGIKDTAALSEGAVKHFADLASFHNAQVADVSDAWQSAIRGQYEPIQRYFPFINDAYMKTFGIARGLIAENTQNLTANQRAIILNAIALDEQLNPAMNDFAETSGGLANQTRISQAQFENLLRTLGKNLLPVALQVVTALNKMLEAFNAMPEPAQKGVLVLLGLAAALGPILSGLGTLIGLISGTVTAWPAITGGVAALTPALASIGAVITGTVLPALGALLASAAAVILPLLLIAATLFFVYAAFKTNFMGITTTVEQLWFIIKHYFTKGWQWLGQSVSSGARRVAEWFGRLRDNIIKIFRFDWSRLGRDIIAGMILGVAQSIAGLVSTVQKAAKAAFEAARRVLDARSPSRKFGWLGRMSGLGFMLDFAKAIRPDQIANTIGQTTRAGVQQVNRQSNSNTYNLPGGLSIRDVNRVIDQRLDKFGKQVVRGLRPA